MGSRRSWPRPYLDSSTLRRGQFYFFGTMFNQDLFSNRFPNLQKYSLPLAIYWEKLNSLLETTKINVLFRGFPVDDKLSFPLHKQVTLVPDLQHELFPEFFSAESWRRVARTSRVLSAEWCCRNDLGVQPLRHHGALP